MAKDISAATETVVTSRGEKTYYSFDIVDYETNQIIESFNTTDPNDAKAFYEKAKNKHPSATTNGSKEDPFGPNGAFVEQSDYEVGGYAGPEETAGADNLFDEKDIKDFVVPGSSPYEPGSTSESTSKIKKKTRDLSGMSKKRKENYERLTELQKAEKKCSGVFNTKTIEPLIKREIAQNECVLGQECSNNAFIVLGKDRPGKLHTGYGGKGHTQADAIDIVVGMGGHDPQEVDENDVEIATNPNFFVDSARIYISQKTDIDKNFGIAEYGSKQDNKVEDADASDPGKYGAKSGIAVKADNLRLIGRETIKLVTGTDGKNSQGGDCLEKSGIEIIAMNDSEALQPMVLGDNLQFALVTIIENVSALAKILHGYVKYQMKYNQALQNHTHITHFYGKPSLLSEEAMIGGIQCDIAAASKTELSILKHLTNLTGITHNFLTESGESFINSRLNKVN